MRDGNSGDGRGKVAQGDSGDGNGGNVEVNSFGKRERIVGQEDQEGKWRRIKFRGEGRRNSGAGRISGSGEIPNRERRGGR